MANGPIILGINRTQDASLALMQGSKVICCAQKERFTKKKHDWGKLGDIPLYAKEIKHLKEPIDLVVEGYSSDKEIANIEYYHSEINQHLTFTKKPIIERISHHLSHAYSAFYPSPFESAAIMIIDSVGSPQKDFTDRGSFSARYDENLFEVASFYIGEAGKLHCIKKQLWNGNKKNPVGLGQFYHLLTQCLFPGEGHEGKVMGLAPFGNPKILNLSPLVIKDGEAYIPEPWIKIFNNPDQFRFFVKGIGSFEDAANLAASGQEAFEQALLQVSQWLQKETNMKALCYAGGCALNCVANGFLLKRSSFEQIFVPPAPHDGGTALGCTLYGFIDCLQYPIKYKWYNDYLGNEQNLEVITEKLSKYETLILEEPADLTEYIANLLVSGQVLGLFMNRSEFGPRALGHRSLLADPRYSVMRSWINQNIKGREWFRPIAPIVIEEDVQEIFDIDYPSPFMQFAAPVRKEYHNIISAGTHLDGTARLQTVSKMDNLFLYNLLTSFKKKTGIGVLLNTSFNGKGETIVETLDDAIDCFNKTKIHSLIVPPFVIHKKIPPKNPLLFSDC